MSTLGRLCLVFFLTLLINGFGASKIFDSSELLNSPLRSSLTLPGIMDQLSEIFTQPEGARTKRFFTHFGLRNWNWLGFPIITPYGTNISDVYQVFGIGALGYRRGAIYAVGGVAGSGFGIAIPVSLPNPSGDPSGASRYKFSDLFGPQFLDDCFFLFGGYDGIFQVEAWLVDNKIYLPENGVLRLTSPLLYQGQFWQVNASVPFLTTFHASLNSQGGLTLPTDFFLDAHLFALLDKFVLHQKVSRRFQTRRLAVGGNQTASKFAVDYRLKGFRAEGLYTDKSKPYLFDRDNLTHGVALSTPSLPLGRNFVLGGKAGLTLFSSDFSAVQGGKTLRVWDALVQFGWKPGPFFVGVDLKTGQFSDSRLKAPATGFFGQLELSIRPFLILRASYAWNDPDDLTTMFDLLDIKIIKTELKVQIAF